MCGRYVVVSKINEIEQRFDAGFIDPSGFHPHVNIGPGFRAPIITAKDPSKIELASFGLSPSWAKKRMYLFNARAEGDSNQTNDPHYRGSMGIIQKPSFRKPIRSQRCLVIANAYIEGPEKEKLSKPFLVYPEDSRRPFAFAGLFDDWLDQETGELIRTYSIITRPSNRITKAIGHHRSPVVLAEHEENKWLNQHVELSEVTEMLSHPEDRAFDAYPISPEIKSPRAAGVELIKPAGPPIIGKTKFEVDSEIKLYGMGSTTGRQRRLFE